MKYKKYIVLVAILIILLGTFISINNIEKRKIEVKFEIGEKPGFDLDPEALTFGRIPKNSSATRNINIYNEFNHDIYISISLSKNLLGFLSVSENNFILNPQESKNISFFINSKKESELGVYEGYVIIKTTRGWLR